jgi:hypothetical protein
VTDPVKGQQTPAAEQQSQFPNQTIQSGGQEVPLRVNSPSDHHNGSQIPFPQVLSAINLAGARYQGHSED